MRTHRHPMSPLEACLRCSFYVTRDRLDPAGICDICRTEQQEPSDAR